LSLADLVQKQRPGVRGLEETPFLGSRVGEDPPLVTEELALQHVFRERRAVDLDERLLRSAGRLSVDEVGDELLAGPRLPLNEHGRVDRLGDLVDHLDDLRHGGGIAGHELPHGRLLAIGELPNLAPQAFGFESPVERNDELGQPHRFGQIVESSELERLDCAGDVGVGGGHDDERVDVPLPRLAQEILENLDAIRVR
jgi:hypothetical protein